MTELVQHVEVLPPAMPDVEMSPTGWRPIGDLSFEEWEHAGRALQQMGRAWQWWFGDWVLYGEYHFPEIWAQAVQLTGMERHTLENVISVARRVPQSRRRETLTWSHHEAIAALPPAEQEEWLRTADEENLTVARLRAARKGQPAKDDEPLDPRYVGTISFRLSALDDDDARGKVEQLADRLVKQGYGVTYKRVEERP